MKNLLVVFTVLAMASTASAVLQISVNGVINPPDSEITILPSDTVVIDVHNVGDPIPGVGLFINATGPGTLSFDNYVNNVNPGTPVLEIPPGMGWFLIDAAKPNPEYRIPADSMVLDQIMFHCTGKEDVTITIADQAMGAGNVFDTQVIHQPEPITFALLGLGGLFLRRRK